MKSTNNEAPVERKHKVEQTASKKELQIHTQVSSIDRNEILEIIQPIAPISNTEEADLPKVILNL